MSFLKKKIFSFFLNEENKKKLNPTTTYQLNL